MLLDEPFREELNNPRAYTSLKIGHFLEFCESSSKTLFLSCTVICVILDHKSLSISSQRYAPIAKGLSCDFHLLATSKIAFVIVMMHTQCAWYGLCGNRSTITYLWKLRSILNTGWTLTQINDGLLIMTRSRGFNPYNQVRANYEILSFKFFHWKVIMMLLCSWAKLESGVDHQKKKAHEMEDPNQVP